MARDIPVGNGDLLINFDRLYRIRDLYYPRVGQFNHTAGHVQRFGVWADGEFAWIEEDGWERDLRYRDDTLVTEVTLRHEELGLEIVCNDCVDFHAPVYFRRSVVRDLLNKGKKTRDVRLFFHHDFSINGSALGDTANYDPQTFAVVLYKDESYFLLNACDQHKCGIDHWAIGHKRHGGHEGTWRDAEDGELGRNAISQGSVDATIGFNLGVPPGGTASVISWIACGHSYQELKALNQSIWDEGPERMVTRTHAYWGLWTRTDTRRTAPLPGRARDLLLRSQLILRTQIDNGGAILAANDSDITQFGGDHYSYCWMRDGALVAQTLVLMDQSELSRRFFRYCERCIEDDGYFLHKYTPEGRLASSWHPWVIEGEKVLPIQEDETALVIWALRKHYEAFGDVEFIKPLYTRLVAHPADWMLSYRDANGLPRPSWDLWEERRGVHLFTTASVIGGLRAAAAFAEDFGERDRAAAFREGAETMAAAVRRFMWRPQDRAFARMAQPLPEGGYRLDMTPDASSFALFAIAGFDARDPMVEAEMTRVRERLWVKTKIGGLSRYTRDYYHQIETDKVEKVPGNPWAICTLWMAWRHVERAASLAELSEALPYIDWVVERAEASGVVAEQYHPYTGDALSVSPLTWSHATFVTVCQRYLERHAELAAAERGRAPGVATVAPVG